jgi:hypothetical protein
MLSLPFEMDHLQGAQNDGLLRLIWAQISRHNHSLLLAEMTFEDFERTATV